MNYVLEIEGVVNECVKKGGGHMKVIGLSEAKDKLTSVINDAVNGPIVITRNGKTAAVMIVPGNDDDLERILLSRSKRLKRILTDSHAASA
jgi:prevent-host-death family protein